MGGLPVKHLIIATNSNDILHRFFTKGEYDKLPVQATCSPSMDIGISSNFERYLFYLFGSDESKLAAEMQKFNKSGQLHVWDYTLCPHTACGISAIDQLRSTVSWGDDHKMVCLATAHAGKFHDAVEAATGVPVSLPPALAAVRGAETRLVEKPNSQQAIKDMIVARVGPPPGTNVSKSETKNSCFEPFQTKGSCSIL